MHRALLVFFVFASFSCRGPQSDTARPSWMRQGSNLEHPDYVLVVGTCKGQPDEGHARQCALADANTQLRTVFGANGGLVRDEHGESHMGTINRGNTTVLTVVHDHWVLLAFPRGQLRR